MQQPPEDKVTSWVEDLDPEPPRREGLGQRRELILGLAILLAVLAWAGWQWWSQLHNESEYALGEQAMAGNRLEEAEAHFGSIRDYKDAGGRAQEIAGKIARRDQQYQQATASSNSHNWLRAYAAAQQVVSIQPGYRDAKVVLDQAKEHVYTDALGGTVLSRMDASPPGLYYRDGEKWIWLEGSDIRSEVRGIGPPGHIVYDVPGSSRARTLNIDPSLWLDGSRLMLATLTQGAVSVEPLSLDPATYDFYIWGEQGVWGFKSLIDMLNRPGNTARSEYGGYSITYEKYGSPITSTLKQRGDGWFVMDFAPNGKQILVANIGGYSSNNPVTQLYLEDGDGTNLRFLYTYIGGFFRALFSPDSSRLLLTTYSHVGYYTTTEEQTVTLLDVTGKIKPLELTRVDISLDSFATLALNCTFLQSGKYAGDVLLVEYGSGETSVSVIDPDRVLKAVVHKWTMLGDQYPAAFTWSGEVTNNDGLLVVLSSVPDQGNAYLTVMWDANGFNANKDGGSGEPVLDWKRVELTKGQRLQRAWLQDGYLVYVTADAPRDRLLTVYSQSLPLITSRNTKPPTTATQVLFGNTDMSQGEDSLGLQPEILSSSRSVVFGPGLLAYGDPRNGDYGQLVVKSYDGSLAVKLDNKGYKLYDWSQYALYRGLR